MNRFVCIHGHFYQPPRENPWLEEIEIQESAQPYHDWNERITAECYTPNTTARILDSDGMITDIVNNYSMISFNFGPTLLSWMEKHQPDVYHAILEADRLSRDRFSGHGSAIAQPYNHMIMPLANTRNKRTQVIWGIKDFMHRFGRQPEGMWLPETAVDIETLDIIAEHGIRFTILSPHQALKIRATGQDEWQGVIDAQIDPRRPYLCRLPSGREISIFFYDGPISVDVAFSDLLDTGEQFAARLMSAFSESDEDQLVHIASDGEVYGHHRHYTEMALAFCLRHLEFERLATITIYAEYLESHPPTDEVMIVENSSWSCAHGAERWKSDCGCSTGMHPDWTQEWRAPLRDALDFLRDHLDAFFEGEMSRFSDDPWSARDDYIEIVLDRTRSRVDGFVRRYLPETATTEDRIRFLKLLEMQRQAMLMYTSCGWFFDDITRLEPVQIMKYASRAMQLAIELGGDDYEAGFLEIIEKAPTNDPEFENGAEVYHTCVLPNAFDFARAAAHYALLALSGDKTSPQEIGCYRVECESIEASENARRKLVQGRAKIISSITLEETELRLSAIDLGNLDLRAYVHDASGDRSMPNKISDMFGDGDFARLDTLMQSGSGTYGLTSLTRDYQLRVLRRTIDSMAEQLEAEHRGLFEEYSAAIETVKRFGVELPPQIEAAGASVQCVEVLKLLNQTEFDAGALETAAHSLKDSLDDDCRRAIAAAAGGRIESMMGTLEAAPKDHSVLQQIEITLRLFRDELSLDLDLWNSQNMYFWIVRSLGGPSLARTTKLSHKQTELFARLGELLGIRAELRNLANA